MKYGRALLVFLMFLAGSVQARQWDAVIEDASGRRQGVGISSMGMSDIVVYDRAGRFMERFYGTFARPVWQGWRVSQEGRALEAVKGTIEQTPSSRRISLSSGTATIQLTQKH